MNKLNIYLIKNKEKIIDIINSNKFNINEFIDILIYFNISINTYR